MVRFLASMGTNLNSVSPSKSQAMEALLKEVREARGAHGESRKRKRDVDSTQACRNGQKRSAILSWTYSDTEAEEPEILSGDVQSSMSTTNVCPAHFLRSRHRQPRGSGVRHLVRRKHIWTCRAFVRGTSREFASG